MPAKDLIQSLWIGPELSVMEQLCIRSFRHHGHEFHLFVYDPPRNVPAGTVLLDARKVIDRDPLLTPSKHVSLAPFSDLFRYKLLREMGGWWVDMDTICLAPFEFTGPYVFSSEGAAGQLQINNGMMKAPAGSNLMSRACTECEQMDPQTAQWGATGPYLISRLIREFALVRYLKAPDVFCPVYYKDWRSVLDPAAKWDFPARTRAVHLWNEFWRREGQDKNQSYGAGCLYEQLKDMYL